MATTQEVSIINLEEMAKLSLALTATDGDRDSGAILLKKYQNEWRIADLSGL